VDYAKNTHIVRNLTQSPRVDTIWKACEKQDAARKPAHRPQHYRSLRHFYPQLRSPIFCGNPINRDPGL